MRFIFYTILFILVSWSCSRNKNLLLLQEGRLPRYYQYVDKDTVFLSRGYDGRFSIESKYDTIRKTEMFFTSEGVLQESYSYDSTGNGIESALLFYPDGRIKYIVSLKDWVLDGETWYFSEEGTLKGVYLFRDGVMEKSLFSHPSFEPVDSSFVPLLIFKPRVKPG